MGAGKACVVTVTGTHYPPQDEGQPIVTAQEAQAEFFAKGESRYLFYEEQPEGYPQPLKTRVKQKGNSVEIHRKSAAGLSPESRMVFEPGMEYRTEYATPLGMLLLDIVTETVETDETSVRGQDWPDVRIVYRLMDGKASLGRYELSICARPT
ncbi:MAG: DUF1934 domain-containing protein [Clostridium sp.]|nr:DUF1934 domain-containing protein [Acetatifactor muris]MCM1528197.1 DUF1934 domain-containing protein [Bacteroides sp.]MCM1564292.1 DUF1934 domain-containing protein [Clostridium sp.]